MKSIIVKVRLGEDSVFLVKNKTKTQFKHLYDEYLHGKYSNTSFEEFLKDNDVDFEDYEPEFDLVCGID